jgi:hypothetical protein
MSNVEGMTKSKDQDVSEDCFVIWASTFFPHLSFVIRHSDYVCLG